MIFVVTRYARDLEKPSGRSWTDENTLMKGMDTVHINYAGKDLEGDQQNQL